MHIGGGRFHCVDEAALAVYPDVDFHPKVPLLALAGDDRALLHRHPIGLELGLHGFKNLLTQIVLLQQMPERQDRGLIRDSVTDQGNAGKAAHRRQLDQRILHRRIAEVVPLLQQMDPQHRLQWVGRPAALAAGPGVVGLNQIDQHFPRHNRFHLRQEALALGALFGRGLLVITKTELLDAHASRRLRSQGHSRAGRAVFQSVLRLAENSDRTLASC